MSRRSQFLINSAFRLFGAQRVLRAKHFRQLELTGVPEASIRAELPNIRSLQQWQQTWCERAEACFARAETAETALHEKAAFYRKAAAFWYLADIFLMPDHTDHQHLTAQMAHAYRLYGETGGAFENRVIHCDDVAVCCNYYHPPSNQPTPVILMIPPLGSVKEQIDFQVMPFLQSGFACLTVDLPGVGQTRGTMPLDAQRILQQLLTYLQQQPEIDSNQMVMMGLSLGAYWSMKTAAVDKRVALTVGISTPAISGTHWNRLPGHYWTHFQRAFQTPDLAATREMAEQLSLFHVMDRITCPVLLIHGNRDRVSQPDAMQLFHRETTQAPLSTRIYSHCSHCCLDELTRDTLPFSLGWVQQNLLEKSAFSE
ncbi:MAG: alpha/beta hydrolase [Deltaproteobacteria bacterium]|nr:alpha/beta hydrolase [Deltaproteobacteria bacterium]MBN2671408.1 alpha/beta hydrolase [Deltaproteobacteria bacterium]